MQDLKAFFESMSIPILLAMSGGAARAVRFGFKGWRQFTGSLVVSGFTGVVVQLLLADTTLSVNAQSAIVAVSGYSGGAILDSILMRFSREVEQGSLLPQSTTPITGANTWDGKERRRCE